MTSIPPNPGVRPLFSWYRQDIEAKFLGRGARFTRVYSVIWLFAAAVLALLAYASLHYFATGTAVFDMFTKRGWTPYVVVLFSFWCLLMLIVKASKTRAQLKALKCKDLVPYREDFVLSPATVEPILKRLRDLCDDRTKYILFNRIELALSNLKNMGRIGDVDDVLQSQADNDDDIMDSSYSLLKGLLWAIPVLGFIGTVQGLAQALGKFGNTLDASGDFSVLKDELHSVLGGLDTAFQTTFIALVAALIIQLLLTVVRKSEEELLDECREYCQRHVVGKLRLTPFDR